MSLIFVHQGCLAIHCGELLVVELSLIVVHQGCLAILSGELLGVELSYYCTPGLFSRLQPRGVGCGDVTRNCLTPGLLDPSGELLAVGLSSTIAVFQGCLAINSSDKSHDSCTLAINSSDKSHDSYTLAINSSDKSHDSCTLAINSSEKSHDSCTLGAF